MPRRSRSKAAHDPFGTAGKTDVCPWRRGELPWPVLTPSRARFTIHDVTRKNNKTKQLEILESVYKDIKALEQRYYDEYDGKEGKDVKTWDFQFFNQIEWLSFLINEKKLKDKKLVNFFKPAISDWYDNMFVKHWEKSVIEDEKQFEEFKKLYKKFKGD